jgi:hypothetical protein
MTPTMGTALPFINRDESMPTRFSRPDFYAPYLIEIKTAGRWAPLPNPSAGFRESDWLRRNRAQIADSQQPWVAIKGQQIVTRGTTFEEVFNHLKAWNIRDALVACVLPQQGRRPRRIA